MNDSTSGAAAGSGTGAGSVCCIIADLPRRRGSEAMVAVLGRFGGAGV